ncbi:MAG: chemotaxis protein CheD [Desulfobacterales bacterium]|nr:chemotaxis protein CheD [Desulfobacterales bacterium]
MKLVVDVSDMKVGKNGDLLVTHALGSCLGLTVYDPVAKVGGMLHAMLPMSKINPEKAKDNPYMFVDTGVPRMFKELYALGGLKGRMVVKAIGCGNPLGRNETFKIGERNYTLLKKLLWKNNVMLKAEDCGGTKSRTVRLNTDTGEVIISSCGTESRL